VEQSIYPGLRNGLWDLLPIRQTAGSRSQFPVPTSLNIALVIAGWLACRWLEEFKLPPDTQRIDAPTPYVWIIERTKTDGPQDYDADRKIQAGYKT
jgi:hypothetical protein